MKTSSHHAFGRRFPQRPSARPAGRRPTMACEPLEQRQLLTAVAAGDAFSLNQGGSLVIGQDQLFSNDFDVQRIAGFTQPANGTVIQNAAGQFVYTPRPGFTGADAFTYTGAGTTDTGLGATLYVASGDLNGDGFAAGVVGTELKVAEYSWEVTRGATAGRAASGQFKFTVPTGPASPGFLAAVGSGATVDRVTLVQRVGGPGGATPELVRYTMSDVRFLSYTHDEVADGEVPTDTFGVSFAAVRAELSATAGALPTSTAGVNLVSGAADAAKVRFPFALADATDVSATSKLGAGVFAQVSLPAAGAAAAATGTVQLLGADYGLTNDSSKPGGTAGRSDFGVARLTLATGDGSMAFLGSLFAGRRPDVTLVRRAVSAGAAKSTPETVALGAASVVGVQTVFDNGQLVTTVQLQYSKLNPTVKPGSGTATAASTWDIAGNTGTGGANFGNASLASSPPPLLVDFGTGQLAVDTFTWDVAGNVPTGGTTVVPPTFDNFTFTRRGALTLASPGLSKAAADQRVIKSVKFARRVSAREVIKYDLGDARIDAYSVSTGPDGVSFETFSVAAARVAQTVNFPPAGPAVTSFFDLRNTTFGGPTTDFGRRAVPAAPGFVLDFGNEAASGPNRGQLAVSGFDWGDGLANAVQPGLSTPAGRTSVAPISFTAPSGQSSAALMLRAAVGGGVRLPIVTLTGRIAKSGKAVEFVKYTFTGVAIASYGVSDDTAAAGPLDRFSFQYETVTLTDTTTDASGNATTVRTAAYDVKGNKVTGAGAFPISPAAATPALQASTPALLVAAGPAGPLAAAEAGAVVVRGFDFDVSIGVNLSTSTQTGAAKPVLAPVMVTLDSGPASLAFLRAAATGGRWGTITLTTGSGGGDPSARTRLTLTNVAVKSFEQAADGLGGQRPVDTVTLVYDKIETTVTGRTPPTGQTPTVETVIYDLRANKVNGTPPVQGIGDELPFVMKSVDLGDVVVDAFRWSESNSESRPGIGGAVGGARFGEFRLSAPTGDASANLLARLLAGSGQNKKIEFRGPAAGGGGLKFLTNWTLADFFVTGYGQTVDAAGRSVDTFTLAAVAVESKVVTASPAGGAPAVFAANFNQVTNLGTAPLNFGGRVLPGAATTSTATVRLAVIPAPPNRPPSPFSLSPSTSDVGDPEDPTDDARVTVLVDPGDGNRVGTLAGGDPDAGDFVTFTLVDGAGGRFAVTSGPASGTGAVVVADGGLIAGNARYTITVRATDRGGLFTDQTIVVDVPAVTFDNGVLTINGTDGNDRISFAQDGVGLPVQATINGLTTNGFVPTRIVVNGGRGDDFIGAALVRGVPMTIRGGAGGDSIFSGAEADLILGGAGADSLTGNRGSDFIDGGADNDSIEGNDGDDELHGGDGDDSFIGGAGADRIFGEAGNDRARFVETIDVVDLGAGQLDGIEFYGTAGNDTIVVDVETFRLPEDPHPELTDAQFRAAAAANQVPAGRRAVAVVNGQTVRTPYKGGETIFVFAGAGNDKVSITYAAGRRWRFEVHGGAGNDTVTGGVKDDLLFGDAGNDALDGGDGDDFLDGGADQDTLRGGPGADQLLGGTGRDSLFGDDGDDFLNARDSFVDVLDGGPGTDRTQKDPGDTVRAVEQVLP